MVEAGIERELKLALVDAAQLDALLAALPSADAVTAQDNHYFADADGRTSCARLMIRVRVERDLASGAERVVLTLKGRAAVQDGVFVSAEQERALSPEEAARCRAPGVDLAAQGLPMLNRALAPLGVESLKEIGVMRNTRHRVQLGAFCLEVDRTELPDGSVEAEVEVETDDPEGARAAVLAVADGANVLLLAQRQSKFARTLQAIARQEAKAV